MATYQELQDIAVGPLGSALRTRILIAIAVKANAILALELPTGAQLTFARAALANPKQYEQIVMYKALAEHNLATVETITGSDDSTVQSVVNNVVDKLLAV